MSIRNIKWLVTEKRRELAAAAGSGEAKEKNSR
jgi:hypothetical protein